MALVVTSGRDDDRPTKPKWHLNAAQRRMLRAQELKLFVKQTGRQAQRGVEPNDRRFDNALTGKVRRMKPEQFDALLRDGDDDV